MGGDKSAWLNAAHLSMFINTFYQLRDTVGAGVEKGSALIIGPGPGLDASVFRWKGFCATTLDIDSEFKPDIVGSCHDMSMFGDRHFDVVIASHVLEHLPPAYLDSAMAEIARVGQRAVLYFPVAGRHVGLRLSLGAREFGFVFDLFNPLRTPRSEKALFRDGEHYWEVGYRGFRRSEIRKRLQRYFRITREYRNMHWLPSYNFVLESLFGRRNS